ncbi:MAG: hypothetical protein Q8P57_01905 [Candidatus Pacearchaeota archaeon]|nr:hypothetical protein [Candidatus Pacearchaeota archaeon]
MKKIFSALAVFFILFSFVSAQLDGVVEGLEGNVAKAEGGINTAKEFTEKDKYDFLTEQWKELLLKNKVISGVNGFFEKIDIVFLILLGMHWSLSMQMFFAFLIWISMFLVFLKWFSGVQNKWLKVFYVFGANILLAQINFFGYLGNGASKLIFYKDAILLKVLFFFIVVILIVLWWKVNDFIVDILTKRREKKKEESAEFNQKKTEKVVEGITRVVEE